MAKKFDMRDILNQQSKDMASRPRADTGIHSIPIDRIIPSPKNRYAVENIEALAADIEEKGLMHNLVVKEADGGGMYELISGERRYRACKLLHDAGNEQYTRLPCRISGTGNPAMDELMLLAANATARELTDYEKVWQAGRIKELLLELKRSGHAFKGRMREIVADMLDVSPAQMGRMERIDKGLAPEAMEAFKNGDIGMVRAYELAGMDEARQVAALEDGERGEDGGGAGGGGEDKSCGGGAGDSAPRPATRKKTPAGGWISDRRPTFDDGDGIGNVLVWRDAVDIGRWNHVEDDECWMRCPEGPEEE